MLPDALVNEYIDGRMIHVCNLGFTLQIHPHLTTRRRGRDRAGGSSQPQAACGACVELAAIADKRLFGLSAGLARPTG